MCKASDTSTSYTTFSQTRSDPSRYGRPRREKHTTVYVYTWNTWLRWMTPNIKSYFMTFSKAIRFDSIEVVPTECARFGVRLI